jgi:uncharacterized lipoprotein YmbA
MRRIMNNKLFGSLFLILMIGLIVGCTSVKYPERQQYMLDLKTPAKIYSVAPTRTLEINNVSVASAYSSLEFVYRTTNENYTRDYYNIFFNSPGQQLNKVISRYLQATNLYKYVSSNPGIVRADYILYADVTELYADYRNPNNPLAVVTIRFTLIKPGSATQTVLDETFHQQIPFVSGNAASLVNAWEQGLNNILYALSQKLR